MNLVQELARLSTEFDRAGIDYALCGGLAMAVRAFPRATLDIDLLIPPEMLERAKAAKTRTTSNTSGASPMKPDMSPAAITARLRLTDELVSFFGVAGLEKLTSTNKEGQSGMRP